MISALVSLLLGIVAQVSVSGNVAVQGNVYIGNGIGNNTATFAQAILNYIAPNSSACNVHVYTDVGLTNEINDTNESLYTGSSNDQTRFSFNVGTLSRQFVVGTRGVPENQYSPVGLFYPGTDGGGTVRSRALQANTTYFYKTTCGAQNTTGSFTTSNIPRGMTFPEVNPLTAAGTTWAPTMNETSRTETYIDPMWGTLTRRVNLIADDAAQPVIGPDAGNEFAWAQFKPHDNNSVNFNLLSLQNGGGSNDLYGIPDDGSAARFYGKARWFDGTTCVNFANAGGATFNINPASLILYGVCSDNAYKTGTVTQTGTQGAVTYFYWVVSITTIGKSLPGGPLTTTTSNATLSGTNFNVISWPDHPIGAKYDILRTTTNSVPVGACNCAVATNISALTVNDQSNSLNAYTVNSVNVAQGGGPGFQNTYVTTCTMPANGAIFYNSSVAGGTDFQTNGTCTIFVDTTSISQRIKTFVGAGFDSTVFVGCDAQYVTTKGIHTYLFLKCLEGNQDALAWIAVYDFNTHTIVAATSPHLNPNGRWCGYHTPHQTDQSAPEWYHYTIKELEGGTGSPGVGQYQMTLNGTLDNVTTDLSIIVNNPGSCGGATAPCPTSTGGNEGRDIGAALYQLQVGDAFNFQPPGGGGTATDWAYITSITDSTHIAIHRVGGLTTHANNSVIQMTCGFQGDHRNVGYPYWWGFEQDTTGTTAVAANTAQFFYWQADGFNGVPGGANGGFSGHESYGGYTNDAGAGNQITEGGWNTCKSYTPGSSNPGPTNCVASFTGSNLPIDIAFNGLNQGGCSGNGCQMHPTASRQYLASAQEQKWGLDTPVYEGYPPILGSVGTATGSRYPYTTNGFTFTAPIVMSNNVLATIGAKGLQDISGPSSSLGTAAADNYKVCIALATNECVAGSVAGNVFVNVPGTPVNCSGNPVAYNANTDVCVGVASPYGSGLDQIGFLEPAAPNAGGSADTSGKFTRQVSQGLQSWHIWNGNNSSNSSPDGQWLMLEQVFSMATGNSFVMLVQVPPWPVDDGIVRNTFETKTVTIPQTTNSTNAIIEMGYDPSLFGCSSRQETCAIGNNTQRRPLFETLEQSTLGGYNVTAGSAIATLYALPGHIVFYRVKQCSALPCTAGNLISTGAVQTWVVP